MRAGCSMLFDSPRSIGRDSTDLRRLIVRRLLPFLRGGTAAPRRFRQRCNYSSATWSRSPTRSLLGELADYVGVVDRLSDSAVNEAVASGDVDILVRMAKLGPRLRAGLAMIRAGNTDRLPDDRYAPLVKALDERTRRAWQAVREKSPERVEAYLGLANLALLADDQKAALAQVLDGIKACGDRVELLEMLLGIVASFGTDESLVQVARSLHKAAADAKTDPTKWCLVAVAWIHTRRNDLAQSACDEALALQRTHPLACRLKASILVDSGSPRDLVQARELLDRLDKVLLRVDPILASLNARIMVGSGLWVLVDDEFKAVVETQARLQPKTSAPSVGFLAGVLSAPPTVERADWVEKRARGVMRDDSQSAGARLLRFKALHRLAELSVTMGPPGEPPIWDTTRVAAARDAFDEIGLEERTRPDVVAQLAALQLKGQRKRAEALRTAGGLLATERTLNAFELEVLGAVLTANGRAAEAVRILERAEMRPGPSVGLRVALAAAYHANNQPGDGNAALRRAENSPNRSAREHAEFIAAKQQFIRE